MTFIVMISMEDCVILCADRDTFSIYGDGRSERSGHLARKIVETPDCYITASGLVELIQPVKDRFSVEMPKAVDDMLAIIHDEQHKFIARKPELAERWISQSTWKLSLPMSSGVVAAFYDPEAQALSGLRPGLAMITFPTETTAEDRIRVHEMFPDGRFMQPYSEAIDSATSQVLQAVSYLRKKGVSVSREIDVAIHCGDSRRLLELAAQD
ncbi:hypothetical protein ACIQSO_22150 [Pseudomonas putida]|uniref:hypothetical protein n=1 Tax=Pseudomonas putida TaxID=303 RepID=UPI00383A307F